MLMDRYIHGFVIISLVCILRYSVLVDSHACDEIPWQEPREKQRPSLLSTTTKKSRAGNDNRKRVKETTGVSRVFFDLGRRKDIIEVNHGHQVSNTLPIPSS